MSDTTQWIIVGIILLAALLYIIRNITKRRKNISSCNGCSDCPLIDNCSKKPTK
ncbi:MAG: FeoB-associated Cys-rich membrane protein [Muribaculaceae bacterium]|nr:FeoB-associated Cys-rich membrane protein [Muribaculaceae bacterium]